MRRSLATALAALAAATTMGVAGCGTLSLGGGQAAPPPVASPAAASGSNAAIQLVSGTAAANNDTTDSGVTNQIGAQNPANWEQITATASALGGTGVIDVDGRTLYRFDEDSPNPPKSTCDGPCATTWPPVVVKGGGKLYLGAGIDQSAIGTVDRSDGSKQVTIGGWPVYRFSGDHAAGDVNGQGVKGTWFGVTPAGKKLTGGVHNLTPSAGSDNGGGVLTLQKTSMGSVVADGSGRSLYVSNKDGSNPPQVRCTADCSAGYQPVPATSNVKVNIKGVDAKSVGQVQRPDGSTQMTLEGLPLYTAAADKKAGDVNGQGNGWFALGLDGDK